MTLQEQIRANRFRSFLVILGFGLLVAAFALIIAGTYDPGIAGVVGVVGIGYGLVSYFASGRMVARASGAFPVTREEAPELYRAVENASIAAGLDRTPDVYMMADTAPNAFAAGRNLNTAYVAATTGIVELLDQRELQGVMAHEMAHVRNRDVRLMTISSVLVGSIALASDMLMRITFWGGDDDDSPLGLVGVIVGLLFALLAPLVAMMLQMALSRKREFLADATAVELTGDAGGLASALAKLRDDKQPLKKVTRATAHLYIESPLRDHAGLRSGLGGLFDTHPPLEDRIARLVEMGANPDLLVEQPLVASPS